MGRLLIYSSGMKHLPQSPADRPEAGVEAGRLSSLRGPEQAEL